MTKQNGGPPARTFREFQFIVTPILLIEEEDAVPYPNAADQVVLRGVAELRAFADKFLTDLEQLNAQSVPSD